MTSSRTNGYFEKSDFLNQNNQPMQYLNGMMKRAPMDPPTRDNPDVRPGEVPRRELSARMRQQRGAMDHRKKKNFEVKANRMQQDGTQVRRLMSGEPLPMEPVRRRPHQRGFETDGLQTKSLIQPDASFRCGMQRPGMQNSETMTRVKMLKRPQPQNREPTYTQPNMMHPRGDVHLSALEMLLRRDMQRSGTRGMQSNMMMQQPNMMMQQPNMMMQQPNMMMQQSGMMGGMQQNMMGGGLGASVMNGMVGNRPMLPQMYWR